MKILIAEDDLVSRKFILKLLSAYGECDLVVDGLEALDAYLIAVKDNAPYDLICLDIMMPKVDGVKVLNAIRDFEKQRGLLPEEKAKIIMITALADTNYVHKSFDLGCEAYVAKPIDTEKLHEVVEKLGIKKIK
ncbi:MULTISPECIES: response regulator [Clostridium]|uniref:Stage 0 sporulation protein A homolog n=1 Tax=Clostridium paridis TaxID=2803863 RepID=A0A937K6C0_9CLOT|nr:MULTISPECIES: response regulator [Clostridium]MBL4933465.1 response regulator [Clostridium paridis]